MQTASSSSPPSKQLEDHADSFIVLPHQAKQETPLFPAPPLPPKHSLTPRKRGRCHYVLPAGNLHSSAQVEEVFFKYLSRKYLRHKGDVTPPMSQREWEDGAEKECGSRATRETIANLIMKHVFVLDYLCKKLKDLEDNPSVKAGASDGSLKDCIRDVDGGRLLISPVDSAVSSGSSGVKSTPIFSDHEDCGINCSPFLNLDEYIEIDQLWPWE
ncbi:hypothetical protein NL676_029186 [Syzygium grande]|nr:hypothetical protein NL676_029186 [Syzygium grande]